MIVEHEETPPLSEAEFYRARAGELRQEGGSTAWPDVRERVLALAKEYDLLAESVKQLESTPPSRPRTRDRDHISPDLAQHNSRQMTSNNWKRF